MRKLLLLLLLATAGGCDRRPDPPPVYSLVAHLRDAEEQGAVIRTSEVVLVETAGEELPSIMSHAPSRLRYRVPIHVGARLQVATAMVRPGSEDGVEFRVWVRDGNEEVNLLRQVTPPADDDEEPAWVRHELDLSPWQGRTVDLELEAAQRETLVGDLVAWGAPRVVASAAHPSLPGAAMLTRSVPVARVDPAAEEVEMPRDALLTVEGSLWRTTRRTPLMRLVTEIDGEIVGYETVRFQRGWDTFESTLDVGPWAGRRVRVRSHIEPLPENVRVEWRPLLLSTRSSVRRRPSAEGPNLLLVVVDTLRRDHMSLYGYERSTTPRLDELASSALVWEGATSASSWTLPATASLLTGLYPIQHGVTDGQPLADELETLADRLQEMGLTTLGVSANPLVGPGEGFAQGHELFVHVPWARAETVNSILLDLIQEVPGKRWFAYAHYMDPHDPYEAPAPFSERFGEANESMPHRKFQELANYFNFGQGEPAYGPEVPSILVDAYDEEILYWDHAFGQLVDALEARGELEHTIVAVTSDHGEEFLEHGKLKHGPHLFEETVAVPLIVRAPGRLQKGRAGGLVEIRRLPELLSRLLGSDSKPTTGEAVTTLRPRRDLLFLHTGHAVDTSGRMDLLAVREGPWKLLWMPATGRRQLFDLATDRGETRDLALERPDLVERYDAVLEAWWSSAATPDEPSPAILEKLRAIGYLQ